MSFIHFETTKGQGSLQTTTNHQQPFPRPKERDDSDRQKSGIVHNCGAQLKAVASFDQTSKVASHVHQFSHNMNFANVRVVVFESNHHELLFLEVWHSTLDPNAENDHIVLPEAYRKASREHELHGHARKRRATLLFKIAYDNEPRFHITDEGLRISRNVC